MNSYAPGSPIYPTASGRRSWHMSHAERCAMLHLLRTISPEVALEIGTCHGGSLEHIRQFAKLTYSLDIDPGVKARLAADMPNVEFLTGNSSDLIGQVLQVCVQRNQPLEFALVDGDHSYAGVRADLRALLTFRPLKPLWILMHDSSNPECRRGIVDGGWDENPHVQMLDLDFVSGTLTDVYGEEVQLWGGFALALLLPEHRDGPLVPTKSNGNFEVLHRNSIHYPSVANGIRRWWQRRWLRVKLKGLARRLRSAG